MTLESLKTSEGSSLETRLTKGTVRLEVLVLGLCSSPWFLASMILSHSCLRKPSVARRTGHHEKKQLRALEARAPVQLPPNGQSIEMPVTWIIPHPCKTYSAEQTPDTASKQEKRNLFPR